MYYAYIAMKASLIFNPNKKDVAYELCLILQISILSPTMERSKKYIGNQAAYTVEIKWFAKFQVTATGRNSDFTKEQRFRRILTSLIAWSAAKQLSMLSDELELIIRFHIHVLWKYTKKCLYFCTQNSCM